jgi:hypothetical protein
MISAKRLAVVMPAYNAAHTLVQTVTELPEIVLGGGLRVRKIAQELEPMGGTLTLTLIALLLGALHAFPEICC